MALTYQVGDEDGSRHDVTNGIGRNKCKWISRITDTCYVNARLFVRWCTVALFTFKREVTRSSVPSHLILCDVRLRAHVVICAPEKKKRSPGRVIGESEGQRGCVLFIRTVRHDDSHVSCKGRSASRQCTLIEPIFHNMCPRLTISDTGAL